MLINMILKWQHVYRKWHITSVCSLRDSNMVQSSISISLIVLTVFLCRVTALKSQISLFEFLLLEFYWSLSQWMTFRHGKQIYICPYIAHNNINTMKYSLIWCNSNALWTIMYFVNFIKCVCCKELPLQCFSKYFNEFRRKGKMVDFATGIIIAIYSYIQQQ